MSAIFSFARSCNALNFSFWAMPLSCIRAISLPIAARISSPTVARLCWDSPGQTRINGVSLRAVSSLPRTPNALNAQLSFDGAPAVCQAVNRSQANPASESGYRHLSPAIIPDTVPLPEGSGAFHRGRVGRYRAVIGRLLLIPGASRAMADKRPEEWDFCRVII